jgi:hypothetical protein
MLVVPTVPYSQEEMGKIISLRVEEARTFCFFVSPCLINQSIAGGRQAGRQGAAGALLAS